MSKKINISTLLVFFISMFTVFPALDVKGLDLNMYSQNNILFYNPDECETKSGAGNLSICGNDLPAETIQILESAGVKEKAEENIERYKYAEEKTGLRWEVLAALHFREAGMGSSQSIADGEPLGDYISIDGQPIHSDPNLDAEEAAKTFIRNAEAVYGVDVVNNPTVEDYAWGFLAYNRGYMFINCGNVPYTESPYVMNFLDDDHMHMVWHAADSCGGINNVAGKRNEQVGALAVLSYLCGDSEPSSQSSTGINSSATPSSVSSDSGSISGSEITWIGDSYSTGAKSIIEQRFSGISFGGTANTASSTIQACKFVSTDTTCNANPTNPSGLAVLQRVIDSGDLKPYLVFALGTNGGWTDSDISRFQDMIKDKDTKVIVVNSKTASEAYTDSNNRLKALADANDNITLADWVSAYDASYFASDSTHPSANGGYEKWVEVIADALSNAGGSNCTSSGNEAIVNTALELAWPESGHENEVKPEFLAAAKNLGRGTRSYCGGNSELDFAQDCGIFVSVVIQTSGVDDSYPKGGTSTLSQHMQDSDLWEEIPNNGNEDNLQPGDVFVVNAGSGGGASGHIFIYIGDGKVAQASLCGYTGHTAGSVKYSDSRGQYRIFRAKGTGTSSNCDDLNFCSDDSGASSVDASGGITEEQAQKIADYYNSNAVSASGLPMGTKENCVSFSAWFVSYLTDVTDATNPTRGNGLDVADNLIADFGIDGGSEPKAFSVFSNPSGTPVNGSSNHTGVIVGFEGDSAITIEAAWGGWSGLGHGLAVVWKYPMPASGMSYAYFSDHLDNSNLSQIIGN